VFTVVDSAGSKYLQNHFLWLNQISIVIKTLYFANLTQENIVGKGLFRNENMVDAPGKILR
jgi:hypothetical protein